MGSLLSCSTVSSTKESESAVIAIHSADYFNEQFQASKDSNKLMVIDFSASWCGPCLFIEPTFKSLAAKFSDAVFVKIDVDELSEVSRQWRVEAMPTFVLVKGGEEVSRVIGANKDELERKIHMFST